MNRLFDLPAEVSPSSEWCQRWRTGRHSWRHRSDGGFDPALFSVESIEEGPAKSYVLANHYAATYPSAKWRFGLFDRARALVGVAVFGIPMSYPVLSNTFPSLEPLVESIELSRLVLADRVPANGESWFLARCFEALGARGVRGVVTFADPVPRQIDGIILFPGHIGVVYMASNAVYTGRATARTLVLLPDGQVLSERTMQKIRAGERGHESAELRLVAYGARPPRALETGAAFLTRALEEIGVTRLRHRGNHRYAFRLGATRKARQAVEVGYAPLGYPRMEAA